MSRVTDRARTLGELIADLKGDRSYERLSTDCGGLPTAKRLQQIATSQGLRAFPDPPTIEGLARGLGVSVTEVVLASARSCDLKVLDQQVAGATLVIEGEISPEVRQALLVLARASQREAQREATSRRRPVAVAWDASMAAAQGPPHPGFNADDDGPEFGA